ncbi:MAG TPA: SRPBCC family protein [Bryobacteraceae bacterium]|nr:SRPBCC family protein [Bryobacteraceae bacterium]
MSANEYHFVTHWRVESTVEEVSDVLGDPMELPRWWPSVYLAVKQIEPGDADGIGRVVELHTKGWLPYTLRWSFRVTESRRPYGFSLEAWGDFEGRGVWTFAPAGRFVDITYDWRIRAEKPLLRYLSFLLKPIFSANHRWAMARGEESLRAELGRRAGAGQQSAGHTS